MRVFHGTSTPVAKLLEQKALLCRLLQKGAEEEFQRQLEVYRSSYKLGVSPAKRFAELLEKGYDIGPLGDESATHVFVTKKFGGAFRMAGSGRNPESVVLEFKLPKEAFEPKPLYFSKEHEESELYVPGKIDFSKLTAIRCHPGKVEEHKRLLEEHGLGHVKVKPFRGMR